MKTVLVTGGAGFIGSHLAERLLRDGHRVVVVDDLSRGRKELVPKGARFLKTDISSPKLLAVLLREKPECVFHLAAQIDVRASVADPIADARTNIIGSLRVLDGCLKAGVKKLVFSSSGGAVYSPDAAIPTPEDAPCRPLSPYGVSKYAFELYLNALAGDHGLDRAVLRYSNVYGPRQGLSGEAGVIGIFLKKLSAGEKPVIFGDGEQTRDFVYVDDAVEANILAMRSPATGVFNIGTGVETSVNRIASLAAAAVGAAPDFEHGPAAAGEARRNALDCTAARRVLGWSPRVSLEEGMRRTAEWFVKSEGVKE